MIAKLPDDLAQELERAGESPLPVENPRNHRLYVIVAADQYRGSSPTDSNGPGNWTAAKNSRRFALIDKEIAQTITPDETTELRQLEREIDNHLDEVAPLPIVATRELLERLRQDLSKS